MLNIASYIKSNASQPSANEAHLILLQFRYLVETQRDLRMFKTPGTKLSGLTRYSDLLQPAGVKMKIRERWLRDPPPSWRQLHHLTTRGEPSFHVGPQNTTFSNCLLTLPVLGLSFQTAQTRKVHGTFQTCQFMALPGFLCRKGFSPCSGFSHPYSPHGEVANR